VNHRPYRRLEGFVTNDECNHLYDLAARVEPGAAVVEIGSYLGKSAVAMRCGAPEGVRVVCVDPFTSYHGKSGNGEHTYEGDAHYARFLQVTAEYAIEHIKAASPDAAHGWHGDIGLLFIDAIHEYDAVRADFEAWSPFVPVGGVVAFHDANEPQVMRVIEEVLASGGWKQTGKTGLLVYIERTEAASAPESEVVIKVTPKSQQAPDEGASVPVKRTRKPRRKAS
jgi:predicted O-methyltransferase YrrM